MIFINPQWQGSGLTDNLKFGAETFMSYYKDFDITIVPLSTKDLITRENIKCFEPILEQSNLFKEIIAVREPSKISTLGGDCGIEIVPISYLNQLYKEDICILYIDAHADLNTPASSPSKAFHGMPLRTLLGEGNEKFVDLLFSRLKPEQVCYVGLRDLDEPESEYILRHNITTVTNCHFADIKDKINNFKYVYIHLDLDVIDISEFEFSLFPSSNGLSVADIAKLINDVKLNCNVVGFCITESTATNLGQLNAIKAILDQIEL